MRINLRQPESIKQKCDGIIKPGNIVRIMCTEKINANYLWLVDEITDAYVSVARYPQFQERLTMSVDRLLCMVQAEEY